MLGRRGQPGAGVPGSRPASARPQPGARISPAPGEGGHLLASKEAQKGGGGGEGVKVKSSEAAAGPWAAASAGCFDHGGAVAVSFCSRGSSRAAGRPPWGPALPRPAPAASTREGGRGARPGPLQAPPDVPSSLLPQPPGPRPAVGEGGAGRPQLPSFLAAGPGGWARCQGVLGTAAPPPLLSAAHPARPPDSLTHPTHAHSWPEAMLRSGGRAGAQSNGHALPRPGRAPAAATPVHTRGTRARTAYTHTHARPPNTHLEHTCAHTHARVQARTAPTPSAPGAHPRATGGPTVVPGISLPLERSHFLPGPYEGEETGTLTSGPRSTAPTWFLPN